MCAGQARWVHGPACSVAIPWLRRVVSEAPTLGAGSKGPRRAVRFARLVHRRDRVLGRTCGPRAFGGNRSLTWLPPTVVEQECRIAVERLLP
jgi:hypothetical protein